MRRRGRKMGSYFCLLLLAGMAAVTLLTGSGGGSFAQAAKNYPLTITATSAGLQHHQASPPTPICDKVGLPRSIIPQSGPNSTVT